MRTAIPSLLVAAALTSAIPLLATPAFADPDALAKVVDGKCVPDQQSSGSPAPCKLVDLKDGYVVLKDLAGASQYLVIATDDVSGIEFPDPRAARRAQLFRGRVGGPARRRCEPGARSVAR